MDGPLGSQMRPVTSGRDMPEKIKEMEPPTGLMRLALRTPILLYRIGLGWLLGHRFLLLTHTGRKSGLPRQTVLEVVRYERETGNYYVAVGFGRQSDWYKNILADPNVTVRSAGKQTRAVAAPLSPDEAGDELVRYSHDHSAAFRELARFMGFRLDGTDADTHALGHYLVMFVLKPAA
jgi:deazaflavin-dependent oxidoreductase (nitroreductase family)